ncbi:MAG: long-chain fatty acid--CoA ligase [Acidimicrobiales bacterium]
MTERSNLSMMDIELNAWLLFGHSGSHHGKAEIVSRLPDGAIHRYTYAEMARRSQQLMHALDRLDVGPGERVATLAWNGYRHLEAYFGIPCAGRVIHTLNLRLSPDELAYIVNHAGDAAVLVDPDQLPLLETIGDRIPSVRRIVVLADEVPESTLSGLIGYEELLAGESDTYEQPHIEERSLLGLCYTSGTTGRPKGVEYTHRSTFLHAIAVASTAGMAIGPADSVLPQVPMFHATAWGMPYAAAAIGAKQVFYGGALDPVAFVQLMADEEVTVAAGVPTVWLAAADPIAGRGGRLPGLRHIVCGGSQPSRALIERYLGDFGIPVIQAWGMTETSPLASMAWPQERMHDWSDEQVTDAARTQAGVPLPGIDVVIRDGEGHDVPFDGETMGDLYVRGPWVTERYFNDNSIDECFVDGWFKTGDVAIGSPEGYFVIADRTKDLIKSGGEWISSVDMEAAIMAIPEVTEAAVVAIPDPKWQERPLPCVVAHPGSTVDLAQVRAHLLRSGFASWQLPDRIELIDEIPKTGVGKFDKKVLRARFSG